MKKVLLLLVAIISLGTATNAQSFTHRFDVTLVRPGNANVNTSTTYAIGDTLRVILAQGNLTATDTVAVSNVVGTNFYTLSNLPRLQGDTIFLAKADTISIPAAAGVYPYCVRAFILNRSNPASFSSLIAATFDTTGSVSCVQLTAGFATGLNDFTLLDDGTPMDVTIYPNPAVGNTVNFDYTAQNASEVVATIYDLAGRKILTQEYGKAFKGQQGFGMDVSSLNKGIYILELRQDGIKATGQFVK